MKITQGQKDFEQTLKFIKEKRKKEITRGQQEVKNIKDYYDKAVSTTKTDGEKRYYEAKLKNESKLDQAYREGLKNFEEKQGMFEGDLVEGELEIGQVSAQIEKIIPASEIIEEFIIAYNNSLNNLKEIN